MPEDMQFSQNVKEAIEKAFIAVETAVGPLDSAQFEYEEWDDDLHDCFILVQPQGSKDGLVSIQNYASRSSEVLFGRADKALELTLELGLRETPSQEETTGSRGEILVKRTGCQLQVSWSHTDNFTVEDPDNDAVLDTETWRSFQLLAAQLKVHTMVIEYRGGGDSMDGADYQFTDKEGNEVTVEHGNATFKAIDQLFDELMDGPISGFWNNEGGYGEIKITDVEEDSYWNHWNYATDNETSTAHFGIVTVPPQRISEGDLIEAVSDPVWG